MTCRRLIWANLASVGGFIDWKTKCSAKYLGRTRVTGKHSPRRDVEDDDMKTQALILSLAVAVAGTGAAHAQDSRPSAVAGGAILGGIAGAFIGGHNNDRWAQGAVIGAAAGALIGAVAEAPHRTVVRSAPVAYVSPAPIVYVGAPPCPPPAQRVVYVGAPPPRIVYVEPAPRVIYIAGQPRRGEDTVVVVAPPSRRHSGRQVVYVEPSHRRW
jgi:hypothetical protein